MTIDFTKDELDVVMYALLSRNDRISAKMDKEKDDEEWKYLDMERSVGERALKKVYEVR